MKRLLKRLTFKIFRGASRLGFFVLPAHYYVPLANPNELKQSKARWAKKSSMPGIDVALDRQVAELRATCLPFQAEYAKNQAYIEGVEKRFGPGFGYVEAQALHGVIRSLRPKRIIEVGSGVSTWCIVQALELNEKDGFAKADVTSIEPFPSNALRSMQRVKLIGKMVQDVPVEAFDELEAGDFLFIDSSHAVKPGSDVNFLYLEILPRLKPGVVVHIHDIYFPYDYPRDVLETYFQWMETSLLRAFLINNHKAQILFCLSHLHYEAQDALKEVFPEYRPAPDNDGLQLPQSGGELTHFPASIYIKIQ